MYYYVAERTPGGSWQVEEVTGGKQTEAGVRDRRSSEVYKGIKFQLRQTDGWCEVSCSYMTLHSGKIVLLSIRTSVCSRRI